MNKYTYQKQIIKLRESVDLLEDTATALRNEQNESDDHGDTAYLEGDATLLSLAAELIQRTLPKE